MARKYTKVEHLISIIEERTKAGETYREIGASLGLTREEVRGAMHRHHAKERKLAAGYIPRPKGRPRKEPVSEEAKQYGYHPTMSSILNFYTNPLREYEECCHNKR